MKFQSDHASSYYATTARLTSANKANGMVRCIPYSEAELKAVACNDKYFVRPASIVFLTFSQGEKGVVRDLIGESTTNCLGVFTLNEFQGRDANTVVIVRNASNNKAITLYNDPNQLVVALSRHTRNIIYLTTCMNDGLAERLLEFNRLIGGGVRDIKPCFLVKSLSLKDAPSSCLRVSISSSYRRYCDVNIKIVDWDSVVTNLKRLLDNVNPELPIYISDDLYDRFDGNMLNSALPKLFDGFKVIVCSRKNFCLDVVNELESDTLINTIRTRVNIEEPLSLQAADCIPVQKVNNHDFDLLQFYYNVTFPQSALRYYTFDRYEINKSVIVPQMSDLSVSICPQDYVNDIEDSTYLQPRLQTHMGDKRLNTVQEQLLGLYKRNANVAPFVVAVNSERQVRDLITSFESCLLVRDYNVEVTKGDISEWLNDKGIAQINAVRRELSEVMDFSRWVMMIKSDVKPCLTDDVFLTYPAVQTILFCSKTYNAIFAPFLNQLRKRLLAIFCSYVFVLSDGAISDYENQLNREASRLRGDVLELDMGKFDKSQGLTALLFDCELFVRAGMPRWMVNLWFLSHIIARVKGFGTSLRTVIPHQRRSGDPWTYGGNTFFLLAVLKYYCGDRINYIMVSGDDSLVYGDFPVGVRKTICDRISRDYLFDVKLCTFESKYFCSKFLLKCGGSYRLVPDPIKLLIKLGRRDLRDYQHVEEYRISLMDHVKSYYESDVVVLMSTLAKDRYPRCPPIGFLMELLYNVVMSSEAFQRLYDESPNPIERVVMTDIIQPIQVGHVSFISSRFSLKQGQVIALELMESWNSVKGASWINVIKALSKFCLDLTMFMN